MKNDHAFKIIKAKGYQHKITTELYMGYTKAKKAILSSILKVKLKLSTSFLYFTNLSTYLPAQEGKLIYTCMLFRHKH